MEQQKIEAWNRILKHQGEVFKMVSGRELVYTVDGEKLIHNRTETAIFRKSFNNAIDAKPTIVSDLNGLSVTGPAYVFAILSDPRINFGR